MPLLSLAKPRKAKDRGPWCRFLILKSSLCCGPLSHGLYVLAVIDIILCVAVAIWSQVDWRLRTSVFFMISGWSIAFAIISALCIFGAYKKNQCIMVMWQVLTVIQLIAVFRTGKRSDFIVSLVVNASLGPDALSLSMLAITRTAADKETP